MDVSEVSSPSSLRLPLSYCRLKISLSLRHKVGTNGGHMRLLPFCL